MKLFLLSLILFYSSHSFAKTGYVNLMEAFEKTKQGQKVKTTLEKKAKQAKKYFKSVEKKLQKEEAAFKKEAPLLSEQAKGQQIQKLQQKVFQFQKEAKNKDIELQKLQSTLMNPVLNRLKTVIAEISKKESYTVIENIGNDVLWVASELNLTTKVYKSFNKKYK